MRNLNFFAFATFCFWRSDEQWFTKKKNDFWVFENIRIETNRYWWDIVKLLGKQSHHCPTKVICFSSYKCYKTLLMYLELEDGQQIGWYSVWPDWAIYWTLGKFSKPLATINLPKSPTFLGNFCKGVKIFNFSSEIIFG